MRRCADITGKKFGKLTVIEYIGKQENGKYYWKCKCDCGNETRAINSDLVNGHIKSCGCLKRDKSIRPRGRDNKRYKHGIYDKKLYYVYHSMKQRCYNPKYPRYVDYGGRGIIICDEWLGEDGVVNFYNWSMENGYKDGLSIDRIDNDGNYEPSNCRWTDDITQLNNTRYNRTVTFNGETHTYAEWERILNNGVTQSEMSVRIRVLHWDTEKALLTPIQHSERPDLYDWNEEICYNGETKTISEWCKATGISKDNYRSRIKLGWNKERAATTPKKMYMKKYKELVNR